MSDDFDVLKAHKDRIEADTRAREADLARRRLVHEALEGAIFLDGCAQRVNTAEAWAGFWEQRRNAIFVALGMAAAQAAPRLDRREGPPRMPDPIPFWDPDPPGLIVVGVLEQLPPPVTGTLELHVKPSTLLFDKPPDVQAELKEILADAARRIDFVLSGGRP